MVVDENGNYDFSNDKTWGNAIWQGEANAIVENYSEMFGSHLDPVVTLGNMSKLANVVGAKPVSYTHLDVYKRQESTHIAEQVLLRMN